MAFKRLYLVLNYASYYQYVQADRLNAGDGAPQCAMIAGWATSALGMNGRGAAG
ncbi:MAG: hypothetical protein ACYCZF_03500 [Anaerolineae bacterium]